VPIDRPARWLVAFYPKGIKIADEDMAKLAIVRDEFHGEWNYRIYPNDNQ
jgi:hypothetical protein